MVGLAKALALVGAISMALALPVAAADRPVVLQVIGVKVTGDMDAYLEKIKKAQSISKRLGTPTPRVWRSTLAGPDTGTVFVAIEHKNMAALAEAQTKLSKDSEWQSFLKDMEKSGLRTVQSNSLLEEITP
jgi:hypothetical protein